MDQRLVEFYKRTKALYLEGVSLTADLQKEVASNPSPRDQADIAFGLNEANKMLEDLGKECRRVKTLCEKICNLICLKNNDPGPVRTPYVRASLRHKLAANMPKRDSKEYQELCAALGVPSDGPIRLHYPTITNMITEAIESGEDIPSGLGELRPEFHLTLRKVKEVDDV